MPRLIRRRPLAERIKSYLNPLDFLLWLSEEIDANDWDQFEKDWALPVGVALNLVFLVARANSQSSGSQAIDDVFGEDGGVPWLSWLASFIVHMLAFFSVFNAVYTFYRKRHYRLFEAPIDQPPATPSAHRVRVQSTPMTASPLRYLAGKVMTGAAESRAHPDAQKDVWELAVWDPLPICLRLFCLFSPGHVLVYWLFLPTQISDPRPSITIVTTLVLTTLLSVQASLLSSSFTQQAKDSTLVHKEVLKEYDIKYVHPRTQPRMRDVGTQFSEENATQAGADNNFNKVDVYTPTTVVNRGFMTSPNPNYVTIPLASHQWAPLQTPSHLRDASPLVRGTSTAIRQPQFRPSSAAGTGDGGSLGVFSHANSPLRKSTAVKIDSRRSVQNPGEFFYKDRGASPLKKASSPLKRSSIPGGATPAASAPKFAHPSSRRETGYF
ncbi:hypothetical protein ASPZODRAFT_2018174 [Penicilliopsis zonata CBS 506.65]|uniref:Meiotically up-regulated gene 154 protein n=1 Tax=Penicilliopsis zonata CBS 506.65 TaxID=1073090 RepID=A0A1L9SHR5_9EURO|nr:hypothetical protein ASPZODRAFT_2018174 [Penicilliopsis zonata CBS 506.65]OJJ46760.1 hypothetical protein ASPZODRAFT_2018174 [Penicilliopsis zonata CBS 506.65]